MAYPSEHYGLCSNGALRVVLVLLAMFLVCYTVGPRFHRGISTNQASSCSCDCDCSQDSFTLPLDFLNISYQDCGKQDPEMREELEKDMVSMLSEEISLQRRVANESFERTMSLTKDARNGFPHYQREAEKCNAQMEICEEARERAETELVEERKLTKLWEERAREIGWEESGS